MIVRLLFLLTLMSGCALTTNEKHSRIETYDYIDDLNYYLNDNFGIDLYAIGKERLYIVPISSCTPCVDKVLLNLENNLCESCAILFVGTSSEIDRTKKIESLSKQIPSYFDKEGDLYQYQTNIGKPSVLFISKKEVTKMTLSYTDDEDSKKILNWK